MTLRQLKIFLCAAKTGSFTRAAHELRMTQPDVSVHIRNLEEELDIKLFERLGKSVRLTQAGRVLRDRTGLIFSELRDIEVALAELKGLKRGSLLIGASTTIGMYLLSQPIRNFGQQYPGVRIHLRMANSGVIEQLVLGMEVDLGFTVGQPIPQVKFEIFMEDEIVLVLPPKHPLSAKRLVRAQDLREQIFVTRGPESTSRRALDRILGTQGIEANILMELDNVQAVKWAVAEGLGLSFVPEHAVVEEARKGLLSVRRISGISIPCPLNIIWHPQRSLPPTVKALLDFLPKRVKEARVDRDSA